MDHNNGRLDPEEPKVTKNEGTNLKSLSSAVSGLGSSEGGSGVWEMLLG